MIPVKSIRVGPYSISVDRLKHEDRDNNLGTFSATAQSISLREHYANEAQEAETVLHELIHAIWAAMGIKPKDGEERIVSLLSVGMALAIRDNPELIQWFSEALK